MHRTVHKCAILCRKSCFPYVRVLSDKVGPQPTLQLRMSLLADVELANHPGHVAPKCAHRLHTLFVLSSLTRRLTIDYIPVLRTDNGHIQDGEVLVQAVKGSRCSTPAADDHAGSRFEQLIISVSTPSSFSVLATSLRAANVLPFSLGLPFIKSTFAISPNRQVL